jgi:hypothetical protein
MSHCQERNEEIELRVALAAPNEQTPALIRFADSKGGDFKEVARFLQAILPKIFGQLVNLVSGVRTCVNHKSPEGPAVSFRRRH